MGIESFYDQIKQKMSIENEYSWQDSILQIVQLHWAYQYWTQLDFKRWSGKWKCQSMMMIMMFKWMMSDDDGMTVKWLYDEKSDDDDGKVR
jgi:hypothetical protein